MSPREPLRRSLADGAGARNYIPPPGSPAIDIGGPDLLPSEGQDLLGDPPPTDGDRDGIALIDAGALEAPVPPPPLVPAPPVNSGGGAGGGHKVSIAIAGKHPVFTQAGVAKLRLRLSAPTPPRGRSWPWSR
jgi:hypothetical protein